MKRIISEHRSFWTSENRRSLYAGVAIFALSFAIQIQSGQYAAKKATNVVGDIFLDNLPILNMDFVIIEGALLFTLLSILLFVVKPRYVLFGIKALAILILARSAFITLTHLGVYPGQIPFDTEDFGYGIYRFLDFRGDLFFSGHTSFPFLMALIFWREKRWRYVFVGITVLFGASVLLAHIHYSIDVFAAPFIVHSIFMISQALFRRDYALIAKPRES